MYSKANSNLVRYLLELLAMEVLDSHIMGSLRMAKGMESDNIVIHLET
jgi:hypothetical protein